MSEWYYIVGGQQNGPITAAQLKSLAASGTVGPADLVWNQSMTEWLPAQRVRGLNFDAPVPMATPVAALATNPGPMPAMQAQPAPHMLGYTQPVVGEVTVMTVDHLRRTRPWVILTGVVLILWSVGSVVSAAVIGYTASQPRLVRYSSTSAQTAPRNPIAWAPVLIMVLMAVVTLLPSIKLFKYASAIRRLIATGRASDLEAALNVQRGYWRLLGILFLTMIAFYMIAIVLGTIMTL